MTIREPQWDDLLPWVHDLGRRGLAAGPAPRAAVVVFDDRGAVLLGRPGVVGDSVHDAVAELVAVLGMLGGADAMAVAQPVRLRDPDVDGVASDATATTAMNLTRAWRDGDVVRTATTVVGMAVDDLGRPAWDDPVELEDGPVEAALAHALSTDPVPDDEVDGVVYAADRFGHGVGAAPRWLARRPRWRLDPDQVRREDRSRVRDLTRVAAGGRP